MKWKPINMKQINLSDQFTFVVLHAIWHWTSITCKMSDKMSENILKMLEFLFLFQNVRQMTYKICSWDFCTSEGNFLIFWHLSRILENFSDIFWHVTLSTNRPRYKRDPRLKIFDRVKPVFDRHIFDKLNDILVSFLLLDLFLHPSTVTYWDFFLFFICNQRYPISFRTSRV